MKSPLSALLFSSFVGMSLVAGVNADQVKNRMKKVVSGQQLHYWLHLPEEIEKAKEGTVPVMLFLHGAGERGDNLELVKVHGPPKMVGKGSPIDGAIVVSPQCPAGTWWNTDVVKALLDEVIESQPAADLSRIYITGLSMGGYGTWGMISEYPDFFAAAAPICGGGDRNRLDIVKDKGPVTFSIKKLVRAKDIPIWAFHGDKDGVVPAAESKMLVDALKEAGAESIQYTIYPGVGHDSWSRTYAEPELYKWMFAQKKK